MYFIESMKEFLMMLAGAITLFFYLLALPWKLAFAVVPPPRLGGGWLCFCIALCGIGLLTALIGDLASHMGEPK